jgi:hypothetical protein
MSVSCASSDYSYDITDGGGDCSISYGYGGGSSGGSGGSSY